MVSTIVLGLFLFADARGLTVQEDPEIVQEHDAVGLLLGGQLPGTPVLLLALLYSLGAHGIMTLNDFKSIEGDRKIGIRSLPAQFGADAAAKLACVVMAAAQVAVIALLLYWSKPLYAASVGNFSRAFIVCRSPFRTKSKRPHE